MAHLQFAVLLLTRMNAQSRQALPLCERDSLRERDRDCSVFSLYDCRSAEFMRSDEGSPSTRSSRTVSTSFTSSIWWFLNFNRPKGESKRLRRESPYLKLFLRVSSIMRGSYLRSELWRPCEYELLRFLSIPALSMLSVVTYSPLLFLKPSCTFTNSW